MYDRDDGVLGCCATGIACDGLVGEDGGVKMRMVWWLECSKSERERERMKMVRMSGFWGSVELREARVN